MRPARLGHFGLVGMREPAEASGGELTVESARGEERSFLSWPARGTWLRPHAA